MISDKNTFSIVVQMIMLSDLLYVMPFQHVGHSPLS